MRRSIEETLWPTRCAVCDRPGDLLCDDCRSALRFIDAVRACPTCGAPHGIVQCTECNPVMLATTERETLPYAAMASAVALDEAARRLILAYKDGSDRRLARVIASFIAPYANPAWLRAEPLVTFVPSTRSARARRGFDHAELTSTLVAEMLGAPHARLFGEPRTHDQRALSRHERAENMGATLALLPGVAPPKACLVVDDVCTTGATLYSAADALMRAGTETCYALTFARA